jgi:ParB/RepB/Spo0J family partition protein
MNDQVADIPTEKLTEPWVLLRPVLTDSVEYLEMFNSLNEKGFLNSISVRPSSRQSGFFEVIDGMWRTTCARELHFPTVPCIIKHNITDQDVLTLQIQAQAIRPETKPVEYARQLQRIQKARPGVTLGQLAALVNKNPHWVSKQLGLLKLDRRSQNAVDRGEIPLANAYLLAKLPPKLRPDYVDQAKALPITKFGPIAAAVIKQFKEAVRQGKLDAFFTEDFTPQAYLRSLKDVETEARSQSEAPLVITAAGCTTPLEGWNAALQWIMHLDPKSVEEQETAARAKVRKRWSKEQGDSMA